MISTITISFGGALAAFVAALGIPGAIMGLVVWRLEKKIEAREAEQEKKRQDQQDLLLLMVQGNRASIALGEATARAIQRIPDAHCNGDMKNALDYATSIKHKQKEFLDTQGIHALWDD